MRINGYAKKCNYGVADIWTICEGQLTLEINNKNSYDYKQYDKTIN